MILGEGLEEIRERAFRECTSLREILIPPAVKVMKGWAFSKCSQLTDVILGEGLEEIGVGAFARCTSLHRLVIPLSVRRIHKKAFFRCSSLTSVVFCNDIEEFVTAESIRDWWNQGVHEKSISTYCFLVECNIPEREGRLQPKRWRTSIHGMLKRIPLILSRGVDSYFDAINSKLTLYEDLEDAPAMLELAIWKSKITEKIEWNNGTLTFDMKMQCRNDSILMVIIIVPCVLSFLTGEKDGNDVAVGGDGDSNGAGNIDGVSDSDDDEENDDNIEDEDENENGFGEDGDDDGDVEHNRRLRRRLQ